MLSRLAKIVLAVLTAFSGGLIFFHLGVPLPWTLGSLAATAIAVTLGRDWFMPPSFREVARPLIGVLAGSAFTPVVLAALVQSWTVILYVASYSVIITILGFFFFTRLCRYDRLTAFFMSTPGGLSELIMIGSRLGGNMRPMVLTHTIRVVSVVFMVPIGIQLFTDADLSGAAFTAASNGSMSVMDWLLIAACCAAGYVAGTWLKLQGGAIIVALIASAVLHATDITQAVPPQWLVALVQIVIGAAAGSRFAGMRWAELRGTLVHAVSWAAVMLLVAVLMALVGSTFLGRSFQGLLLGMSPGGLPEMTIVTYALGIDVAFVVTCHVCRVFMVLLIAPHVGGWLSKRQGSASGHSV